MVESQDMELFWGISRAQYLTVPRSIIQEMPKEWQDKLAQLLNELDEVVDWRPEEGTYYCYLRRNDGRFTSDPLAPYRHGNLTATQLFANKGVLAKMTGPDEICDACQFKMSKPTFGHCFSCGPDNDYRLHQNK